MLQQTLRAGICNSWKSLLIVNSNNYDIGEINNNNFGSDFYFSNRDEEAVDYR